MLEKTIPSFFIIGAPKCGTSAMFQYLKTHPGIFTPVEKEVNYFSSDLYPKGPPISNKDAYISLFKDCGSKQIAGEASVLYMYSKVAVKRIKAFNADAKLIILVRNPVDMLHAYHQENINNWDEDCKDFELAWNLEERRSKGSSIPKTCDHPKRLLYSQVGQLGAQVKRVLSIFPKEQVKVILFDDFIKQTADIYAEVLSFLELQHDGRKDFPKKNAAKARKFQNLTRPLYRPPATIKPIIKGLQKISGPQGRVLARTINRLTMGPKVRKPLRDEFRQELVDYFAEDIACLSECIEKDLTTWLKH